MKILFGPYGCILASLGIPSDVLSVKRQGQTQWYRLAVEMIARGYVYAGATLPTVNAFFLRPLLHLGFHELYEEMLKLNLEALLAAFGERTFSQIAICLGPAHDCYRSDLAPDEKEAQCFAELQYDLCRKVLHQLGFSLQEVVFLQETVGTAREALGMSKAAYARKVPLIISFVVHPDGRLLSGENVEEVIDKIDATTSGYVQGFSINCCAPCAFDAVIHSFKNPHRKKRIVGFYPNSCDAHPSLYETEAALEGPKKIDSLQMIVDRGLEHQLHFVGGCCGFGYYDIKQLIKFYKDAS